MLDFMIKTAQLNSAPHAALSDLYGSYFGHSLNQSDPGDPIFEVKPGALECTGEQAYGSQALNGTVFRPGCETGAPVSYLRADDDDRLTDALRDASFRAFSGLDDI
jgi:hypothetical protein